MDILEKFIRQVSYRFPKGYPDMNNEADRKLLFELFEAEAAEAPKDRSVYDRVIAKVLTGDENGEIPQPSHTYTIGKNVNLAGEDEKIFSKLYPISPPKSGKDLDSAGSKGSGNGEIAMHWLLSKGHTVEDTRGSDNPDLLIDGTIGLEVKAYEVTGMTLGRYGSDKDNIAILGVVFGVSTLVGTFQGGKRTAGTMTFNTPELLEAFKRLSDFDQSDLRGIAGEYALIQNIYNNIDSVKEALHIKDKITPEHGTAEMLRRLIATKLTKKPGIGGYIVNVSQKGSIKYTQITQELLDNLTDEQLLKGVSTNQGALNIITNTLFPS
jgi:hypothetical protein